MLALAKQSGNERFAWDSYRRLLLMFGEVVMGLKGHKERAVRAHSHARQAQARRQTRQRTQRRSLKRIIGKYKAAIKKYTGKDFPTTPTSRSGEPSAPCSARG